VKQAFWRLPLLALTLAAALPTFREAPVTRGDAAAFVAAQDSARIETQIPVLPLLGRGSDTGGALRAVVLSVTEESHLNSKPGESAPAALHPSFDAPAASRGLGRAPPAGL
jgi:hypothetical protein